MPTTVVTSHLCQGSIIPIKPSEPRTTDRPQESQCTVFSNTRLHSYFPQPSLFHNTMQMAQERGNARLTWRLGGVDRDSGTPPRYNRAVHEVLPGMDSLGGTGGVDACR
uniref:Uncharacterized protein n=1 Tax=Eutreptiella gymnastica TaxID=73025 RepID=A0A7S4LJJ8_9EUGL|mmetsp:Transcript_24666/g.39089  ORF Transcript_24666/g.39089 Transcript_24666/m.39089 type:complete len:109 (+) Transcript_24666:240-566(+)